MPPTIWKDFEIFVDVIIQSYREHLTPVECAMKLKNKGMPIPEEEDLAPDSNLIESLKEFLLDKLRTEPELDNSELIQTMAAFNPNAMSKSVRLIILKNMYDVENQRWIFHWFTKYYLELFERECQIKI